MGWRYYFLYYFIWNVQYIVSAHKIYKLLGESLSFPLNTSEMENISDVTLRKNGIYLFRWERNDVNQNYVDRLGFHGNRTLKLEKLEERDAGPYELELFDMAGTLARKAEFTLILICQKGFHEVQGDLGVPVTLFGRTLTGLSPLPNTSCEKHGSEVAQLNKSTPVKDRLMMLPTGECRLVKVQTGDEGIYTLDVRDGDLKLRWSAQLVIRVPKPYVEQSCLSDGRAEFHCKAKGGVPTQWILSRSSLRDTVQENNTVLEVSSFSGELLCAVKDYPDKNVSMEFTCTGRNPSTITYIVAVCCTLGVALILSLAAFYMHQKRQKPDQSPQMTTMAPSDVIEIIELTDTGMSQPRPPSLFKEVETIYSRISPPVEMSTFVY